MTDSAAVTDKNTTLSTTRDADRGVERTSMTGTDDKGRVYSIGCRRPDARTLRGEMIFRRQNSPIEHSPTTRFPTHGCSANVDRRFRTLL